MASLYEQIVGATVQEFMKYTATKLRELNGFKENLKAGDKKTYISYPIHRLVFGKAFGCKFNPNEGKYPLFELKTLERLSELFGSKALVKINCLGDLALASPTCYIDQVEEEQKNEFYRGDICIPLKEVGDTVHCFFPAGVDDDDKPLLPLSSLLQFESIVVPERVQPGFSITIKKGKFVDYVSLPVGHGLVEGDDLVVRGKSYKIIAISDDDSSTLVPFTRNIIRVNGEFTNNCSNQKLRFKKNPTVAGKILEVSRNQLRPHQRVLVTYKPNSDENDHGVVEITFNNVIFNSTGILTQDRSISIATSKN